jgi:hypothetical protein
MADRIELLSDDDILDALAASFPVEPAAPEAAQLYRLSLAVAELRATTAAATAPRARWSLPRRLSPLVLAGSVVGVVGAGTGISFAVGAPIPAAVRTIARSVGLDNPVTPTTLPAVTPTTLPSATVSAPAPAAVSAARQAEATLSHALAATNPPLSVLAHDSSVLAHRLAQVTGPVTAGAAGTTTDGHHLLSEACRLLEGGGQRGSASTQAGLHGTTFPDCGAAGVGRYPPGTSKPATVPTSTPTTELTPPTHPSAGTSGGGVKTSVEGSSGSRSAPSGNHSDGTLTGGSSGTTSATSPNRSSGGSSGGRAGNGTSSGWPDHDPTTTNPRSSATPPTN